MKLSAAKRTNDRKSDAKVIRRSGNIPAILYANGKETQTIFVKGDEFGAHLRDLKPGQLSTSHFVLSFEDGEKKALVKDIQYHPATYAVLHLDFEEMKPDTLITVKVPIVITGAAECAGIKLGGFLRQVIRCVKVRCLPKDIPTEFVVDVKDLGIRQTKRLRDIALPKGVKPLAPLNEVVVVIAKR